MNIVHCIEGIEYIALLVSLDILTLNKKLENTVIFNTIYPCQCYSYGPGNLSNVGNNTKYKIQLHNADLDQHYSTLHKHDNTLLVHFESFQAKYSYLQTVRVEN